MFVQYYIEHLYLFLDKYPYFFKINLPPENEITPFLDKKVVNCGSPADPEIFTAIQILSVDSDLCI